MAGKPWTDEMKAAAKLKREAAAKLNPKPKPAPRPAARRGKDPVAEAVETIVGVLSLPLMALGTRNESFLADALALELTAQPLGEAMAEVAKVNPAVGEWLEKGAPATPYILLGTVLFSLGSQIAVNHGANLPVLVGATNTRSAMIAEKRRRIGEVQAAQASEDATAEYQRQEAAERARDEAREAAQPVERSDAEYARRVAQDGWEPRDMPLADVVI